MKSSFAHTLRIIFFPNPKNNTYHAQKSTNNNMANLNKVMIMGNLTRDPDIKHTSKGTAVAELSVAVNRKVPDGNDGWKNEPTFIDVTAWGSSAENAHKYLTKGRGVYIEGRLSLETWDDKATGQKRSKLKVVCESLQFLPDGKASQERSQSPPPADLPRQPAPSQPGHALGYDDEDDDITF